jgi:hypothetical protein
VRIALTVSSAVPETSATRSCASRESSRTRRPTTTIGTTTTGTMTRMKPVRRGLVTTSSTRPPTSSSRLRRAWVTLAPITVWITVVSVVIRETTSPVRVTSKKPGERCSTWR